MDSRLRTKFLYEDPNSIFKSGKKVYLHELQGATLKTTKPTPDDITIGLKGAESMVGLIGQLDQLQNIVEFFYTQIYNEQPQIYATYNAVSLRDANKNIKNIKKNIDILSKLSPKIFNEDDIYTILNYKLDLITMIELIVQYIQNNENPDYYFHGLNPFFNTVSFNAFIRNMGSLDNTLSLFIKTINITGISLRSGNNPIVNIGNLVPLINNQPDEDEPLDIPPAEPLEGAGRFKVLSNRIRKQQPMAFKRFL